VLSKLTLILFLLGITLSNEGTTRFLHAPSLPLSYPDVEAGASATLACHISA
jgi:hypothetical protein